MSIPTWTSTGALPPVRPGVPGHDPDRSPFKTTIVDVVSRFSTSQERCRILDGLLRYRRALNGVGLTRGFQWLDGSFIEEVEVIKRRPPNDIDVVTFAYLPMGVTSQKELIDRSPTVFRDEKSQFHVDAYHVQLGTPMSDVEMSQVVYWYSMWSHRRDGLWKGFLQIDLDLRLDAEARAHLDANAVGGGDA